MKRIVLLSTLASAVFATNALSQTIWTEDFSDGLDGWTHFDSTVGTAWGPGSFSVIDEEYRLQGGGFVPTGRAAFLASRPDLSVDEIRFSNGHFRAQVRTEEDFTYAGIVFRSTGPVETGPFNGYLFAGTPDDGRFFISRYDNNVFVEQAQVFLDDDEYRFGVGEDWMFEASAFGDQFSLKVWPIGEQEPAEPQLTLVDGTYATGHLGVVSNTWPGDVVALVDAVYDDLSFDLGYAPGDANGDGAVDLVDFNLLKSAFGTDDVFTDFDESGVVDLVDFNVLKENFGASAAIPEPGAASLAAIALLGGVVALLCRRSRLAAPSTLCASVYAKNLPR